MCWESTLYALGYVQSKQPAFYTHYSKFYGGGIPVRFRSILIIMVISLLAFLIGCSEAEVTDDWISSGYSQHEANQLQKEVDEGHKPGALEWRQVAREFLNSKEIEIDESVDSKVIAEEDSKLVVQYTLMDQRMVQLELIQPSKEGNYGIYVVSRYQFITE